MSSSPIQSNPAPPAASKAAFYFIIVTVCLDFIAFGIIVPVLPNLILQFESGNISRAAAISGWFGFAWATMQFVFSPILGALSDRYGRRPVILLSCFGLGLDYIFMAVAPSLRWLFVGRLISGVTASNIATAFAYITDVTPPAKRAQNFGMLSAAFGLGFIVGPAIGGFLSIHNLRMPFWVAAGFSLASALYGYFILPESLPPERRDKSGWHVANPVAALPLLRSHPELAGLAVVATLFYLAHNALPSVWVLYTEYRYHWTRQEVSLSLTAVGVCAAIISGGIVGPYVRKFGERFSLLSGLCYGVLGFLGFALATSGRLLFAAIPFIALWGVSGPAMQSLMSQRVDHTSQGKLQGAINSIRSITQMAGMPLFSQVFAFASDSGARFHFPGAPYFLAAILLSGSLGVAAFVVRGHAGSTTSQPAMPAVGQ